MTANTIECIEALKGEKLLGVIPRYSVSDITSSRALVFESGRALVICDNGSYYLDSADKVRALLEARKPDVVRMLDLIEVVQVPA